MKETDFKKGDVIIITGRPTMWASTLNNNYPLGADTQYPFECVIDDIQDENDFVAISAGGYGWDLSNLVTLGKVKLKKEAMRTISANDAQRIIDSACSTWSTKLATKWGTEIVQRHDILITEDFYKEMRKACTSTQNELFDDIFGSDYPFKEDDYVVVLTESGEGRLGYCHNRKKGEVYRVYSVDSEGLRLYNKEGKKNSNGWLLKEEVRLATEDEIKKASYPADGTPCLVSNSSENEWYFRYSDGKGAFYNNGNISGHTTEWENYKVLNGSTNLKIK